MFSDNNGIIIRFFLVLIIVVLAFCCDETKICLAFVVVVVPFSGRVPQQQQQQQHELAWLLSSSSIQPRQQISSRRRGTKRGTATATSTRLFYSDKDISARDALERTAAHLERLKQLEQQRVTPTTRRSNTDDLVDYDDNDVSSNSDDPRFISLYQGFIRQSANSLKEQLKQYQLPRNGRKPDLARRLAAYEIQKTLPLVDDDDTIDIVSAAEELLVSSSREATSSSSSSSSSSSTSLGEGFSTLFSASSSSSSSLSDAARVALRTANFLHAPSCIQTLAIPALVAGESLILHAATGSGKTLAYLLPITERLWREQSQNRQQRQPARRRGNIGAGSSDDDDSSSSLMLILTPTRELAAQVAGIATVLAPPGTVRFVSRPTNLLSTTAKDQGEISEYGGRRDDHNGSTSPPRLYIGSAKTIQYSLYGDGGKTMPASPTPKPLAMEFLQRVDCCVLDEVDRLLQIAKTKSDKKVRANRDDRHQHERPAAVITAAILRLAGIRRRVQIVAASATVGRPLKRELARVMGLSPQDCPRVIVATTNTDADDEEKKMIAIENGSTNNISDGEHDSAHSRAVTIPDSVKNYIVPVQDGTSDGKLLTAVAAVIHALNDKNGKKSRRRILLVLSRGGFEMSTRNVIGALKHFNCQPEPTSLLDALEADGTDRMMQVHRQVSKSAGVGVASAPAAVVSGGSSSGSYEISDNSGKMDEGYLLVTGEETIRGLHLDGLDVVISVGRPQGPDEYTHIAGRTGRQGRPGIVLNIVSDQKAATMKSWQRMLNVEFTTLDLQDVGKL
jgi:DEAD/DEAH box helicase